MKLKPQPRPARRTKPAQRAARPARGRPRLGAGRQASRPGVPVRRRLARRIPPLRRVLAVLAAGAVTAGLVAALNGPWLRVTDLAWTGSRFTSAEDVGEVLYRQEGASLLAVNTAVVGADLERLPSVADASVAVSLTGRVEATIVEREPAFVWQTPSATFVGAADGTIFAGGRGQQADDPALAGLPRIRDGRFAARVVTVGDVIAEPLVRIALDVAALDPAALGSRTERLAVRLDDEYGFRIVSEDPAWEIALGVYGLDPNETLAEAEARLERQVTAVRTLFANRPEDGIGWVDVRNPGKVYFRAKG